MKRLNLLGVSFGRLTVDNLSVEKGNRGQVKWDCICSCGNTHTVTTDALRSGASKSCGCAYKGGSKTHGLSKSRIYRIYRHVVNRCRLKSVDSYYLYGGRGIKVCDEWNHFEPFYKWATSNGYSEDLTIDRIDNNKGYSPDNCQWSNWYEQARNKRNTKLTSDDVREIRALRESGIKNIDIAKKFNISCTHSSEVARSISWKGDL